MDLGRHLADIWPTCINIPKTKSLCNDIISDIYFLGRTSTILITETLPPSPLPTIKKQRPHALQGSIEADQFPSHPAYHIFPPSELGVKLCFRQVPRVSLLEVPRRTLCVRSQELTCLYCQLFHAWGILSFSVLVSFCFSNPSQGYM